ncbi:Gfo/Idh/MocA family protein [Sediminibacillus albus]|uniref:Predicted dehydrogenase n=1 Tax=Sediminibacillus albus TaxID=407036 RepID=A0A1G8YE87_9BACI|nr:Gfo/Idh/MocA family oxidoreductase [Sediminibacillus albus]SDK01021.1 Predicted dehydrogenase [Sediminibacillus albus]
MEEKVSIVLIGINGYGSIYLQELLNNNETAAIKGVVEIHPEKSEYYQQLADWNIPVYGGLDEFYEENDAALAIISTPIHLHKQQAISAMQHGSHVLCEKPASGNPEDIEKMIKVRNETGKFLAIGFNWSFTTSVQELKQDIIHGLFGKPKRFKTLVSWPRDQDYYARSSWAGKKYSPNGDMIFDSVANNATAHFLHHLFYLLGPETDKSAELREVTAELYRANDIETFDTCAVRTVTKTGTEVLYYASHAGKQKIQPRFTLEFDNAVISYQSGSSTGEAVIARFNDGKTKKYGALQHDSLAKLEICIEAAAHHRQDILCGIEAASTHVYCINAMHQSVTDIPSFPQELVHYQDDPKLCWVENLSETLVDCYEKSVLPNEVNIGWSQPGKTIKLHDKD